ncbi:DUF4468 domain-containing protein [Pedobacter mucosus]|uniref:DUF4468 domain-containing protein n=1 Tax=Pedobacter mucosus TaxID=2895286 RepID=UPI001EE4E183|nr:DUF4468 domain-containing protein [Pedobacter mucosus]UKT63385.1 DUF4468 domain-containing protein [Pedobacter mucosus]
MNKLFILFLFLICPLALLAQSYNYSSDLPVKEGKLVYEKIVEGIDVKKPILYAAAKKWSVDILKNTGSIIQSEDITTGQIISKGFVEVNKDSPLFSLSGAPIYKFSVQFDIRDGRYRMRIYDIILNVQTSTNLEANNELNLVLIKSPPITGKNKIERAKLTAIDLNKQFVGLLNSFNETLKEAKKDTF